MSIAASVFIFDRYVISVQEPWPSKPLIGTSYKYWKEGESRQEHVPSSWIYLAGGTMGLAMLLLPNNQGWLNHVTYRHVKGATESILVATPFLTHLAKLSFGRERPYYDQKVQEGEHPEPDDRMSFWSGHASSAFSIATYMDWFVINNLVTNDLAHLAWKVPVVAVSLGLATYVAYTRVKEHKHDVLDVTVGAAVGAGASTFLYGLHQNWFGGFYHDRMNGEATARAMPRTLVLPQPNGIAILHQF